MFKIVCINVLFAFYLVWITVYILISMFPNCYEWKEKELQQDTYFKTIKELTSIHGGRNRKTHDISVNQNIHIVKTEQKYICKNWAVVNAISNPTSAIRQIASDNKWCIVIVADINSLSRDAYLTALGDRGRTIVFLNASDQDILFSALSTAIPWGHIGRKNVGYIFAIQNGAELIWDFDSNNQGVFDINSINDQKTISVLQRCRGHNKLFNPYPYFGVNETYIWPRGFPLEFARNTSTTPGLCIANISLQSVGVIQSISNIEPDVDATFRFTREYPVTFEVKPKFPFILVPRYSYCPFNERATLWTKQAFVYMALPISVHSRVSDIWRSYIAQLFFHKTGINLVFSPLFVVQTSSDRNLLEDFQAEIDIYQKSNLLIDFLHTFQFQPNTTLEYLYEELYKRHFIELEDVYFIRIWTKSYGEVSGAWSSCSKIHLEDNLPLHFSHWCQKIPSTLMFP